MSWTIMIITNILLLKSNLLLFLHCWGTCHNHWDAVLCSCSKWCDNTVIVIMVNNNISNNNNNNMNNNSINRIYSNKIKYSNRTIPIVPIVKSSNKPITSITHHHLNNSSNHLLVTTTITITVNTTITTLNHYKNNNNHPYHQHHSTSSYRKYTHNYNN